MNPECIPDVEKQAAETETSNHHLQRLVERDHDQRALLPESRANGAVGAKADEKLDS